MIANAHSSPDDWVPVMQAASKIGVSRPTVIRWIGSGRLEGRKIGRDWFVAASAVEAEAA